MKKVRFAEEQMVTILRARKIGLRGNINPKENPGVAD